MLDGKVKFDGLVGVGKVSLELDPDQHIYTLIGANGVGKTKTLEALFQALFFSGKFIKSIKNYGVETDLLKFKGFSFTSAQAEPTSFNHPAAVVLDTLYSTFSSQISHNLPIVFLGAQSRGIVRREQHSKQIIMGSFEQRQKEYFLKILSAMKSDFGSLNMETGIEDWFVTLARSSNPYQKKEDNRDVEIKTVIRLLHEIDSRIDSEFLEISGDDRVSLMIEGNKRELSQLSSGFTSILKLIQAIISGYGYFTNENNIQRVKGIVLIDEIESHLHLTWQASIIPLLKKLFPNTTFYITTHSSVVLSQLKEGEAYSLYRDSDGTVKTKKITSPNKAALADILKDVFDVDLNQMKLENSSVDEQQKAKESLLNLLNKQEHK